MLFHSFHNTISQWLFPKLFAGGENERWLGEGGLLPVAGYVLLGLVIFVWTRRGPLWRALFDGVLTNQPGARLDIPRWGPPLARVRARSRIQLPWRIS